LTKNSPGDPELVYFSTIVCDTTPLELRKKPSYFPLYWLVFRDPDIGLLKSPYNWVVFHPLYQPKRPGALFFYCSHLFESCSICLLKRTTKPRRINLAIKVTLNNSKMGPSGSATGRFKDEDSMERKLVWWTWVMYKDEEVQQAKKTPKIWWI